VKKLDRFRKTTYAHCARRDLERHRERILWSRVGLAILLSSVLDAESKKMFSEAQEKHKAKYETHFGEDVVFRKSDILRVSCVFRPEKGICVR
jgi:hypothetical protein